MSMLKAISRGMHLGIARALLLGVTLATFLPGVSRSESGIAALDSAKYAGAFVGWGDEGREFNLRKWEDGLNQPRSSVLAVDFYAHDKWSDFVDYRWVPLLWRRLNPARNVVWSFPLTVKGTPLADIANGSHDREFKAAAQAIADAQPQAIIRIGWEMNSIGTPWFAKGQEQDYVRAFRHVVQIFRRYSRQFKFDWCPNWGLQELAADLVYPGDDVVDYIGLDVYDFKFPGTAEERWTERYLKAPYGLEWQRDFAAAHGKKMSYPEWGVGQFGDNPYFVQKMHDWFVANDANIAYAAYFNVDGDWPTQLDTGNFPQSQALFEKLFRRSTR
jgi:hypothetical protein